MEILSAYKKVHGECPDSKFGNYYEISKWRFGLQFFRSGWACALAWMEEQEEMEKDYQEELQEQERLRRGE